MELTTEDLKPFIGGQIEIQNQSEEYIYRGEIADAAVENKEFHVRFSWFAQGEGYPPIPSRWKKDDTSEYAASLGIYTVQNIGPGEEGGDRIVLISDITGEVVTLFPPDGSKLDPGRVEGLEMVASQK